MNDLDLLIKYLVSQDVVDKNFVEEHKFDNYRSFHFGGELEDLHNDFNIMLKRAKELYETT